MEGIHIHHLSNSVGRGHKRWQKGPSHLSDSLAGAMQCLRLNARLQEREAAKVTHAMDGFVHKAFSVAYATSFDEVRLACHARKSSCKYHISSITGLWSHGLVSRQRCHRAPKSQAGAVTAVCKGIQYTLQHRLIPPGKRSGHQALPSRLACGRLNSRRACGTCRYSTSAL